ncbi:hypothetical protein QYF36_008301 [Acer negundo]|nr:hypothetical protein QYF36_008301 [Acer negundo]
MLGLTDLGDQIEKVFDLGTNICDRTPDLHQRRNHHHPKGTVTIRKAQSPPEGTATNRRDSRPPQLEDIITTGRASKDVWTAGSAPSGN